MACIENITEISFTATNQLTNDIDDIIELIKSAPLAPLERSESAACFQIFEEK